MKYEPHTQAPLVSLPIGIIECLLTMRSALDNDVALALRRSIGGNSPSGDQPPPSIAVVDRRKYSAEFLGVGFSVNTLAAVFGRVVDLMTDVAPEALVSLAEVRTRGRRLISLEPRGIHLNSPHLPVMQTASGWWISSNISQVQLRQALRTLCEVSRLTFRRDVKFAMR